MFKQIFQTPIAIPYRPHDIGITDTPVSEGGPFIQYHKELHAGDYQETINRISGIWVSPSKTSPSGWAIFILCWTDTVRAPGWNATTWYFDAADGAYLGRIDRDLGIWAYKMNVTRQGDLFILDHWHNIYRKDPDTFSSTGEGYNGSHFTDGANSGGDFFAFMFDRYLDRAVMRMSGMSIGTSQVAVFKWSTGEIIRRVNVAGAVESIYFAAKDSCHVVATNGVVTVLDYVQPKVLGVARHTPDPAKRAGIATDYYFDTKYQRILAADHTADDANGASTVFIKGFHPTPLPTDLTKPLPIKIPLVDQATPVYVRAIGDAGEALANIVVSQTMTGDGTVTPPKKSTDRDGWAIFDSNSSVSGSQDITATTEV